MIVVALRQHRTAVVAMVALVALTVLAMYDSPLAAASPSDGSPLWFLFYLPMVLGVVFAVFWAAPLVSREYENRTHLFAWGQDVSRLRWIAGKVVVLAGIAVLLSAVVGYFAYGVVHHPLNTGPVGSPTESPQFESHPLVMIAHTLFGFALGLVVSMITRNILLSMGITLVVFVVVQAVNALFRPYYLTPTRVSLPLRPSGDGVEPVPTGRLVVEAGYTDVAGNPMADPPACGGLHGDLPGCLQANGVAGYFEDFLTADRVPALQLIESGGYVLVAGVLLTIVFVMAGRRA